MNQLCRACLVSRDSFAYALFENVSAEVYTFCTSIEISQNDELPKTLCNSCHDFLVHYSSFKRTCIQAQNTLIFQSNMKLPVTSTNNVKCEIDETCEVVVSEIRLNESVKNEDDISNNLEKLEDLDSSHVDPIEQGDENDYFDEYIDDHGVNQSDVHGEAKVGDTCDAVPLQPKKKIKCKIRKVKEDKMTKTKVKKKTKVFEYVCELCKSKFKYKDRYEAHKLEHLGQTVNKICTICKKVFMTWSGLQRHTDSEHKVVRISTLRCKSCGKVFKNQQTLKLHAKLHELPEDHTSVCDICGKSYSSPVTLKLHMEGHNENRKRDFPCEHCGKKFFTKYILHSHIKRLHTGQRYICQICNYPFTDKYNLSKHVLQKHQGIKEHKCDICQKFFSSHSTLVIHKRIHSGERPYACAYCTKAFSSKNRLIVHHRTHTGERPHHCVVCNLAFTQLGTMKRHMKTHNKMLPPNHSVGGFQFKQADCIT